MASSIKLKSADGIVFPVDKQAASCLGIIKTMMEDIEVNESEEIPLPNVESKVLEKVLSWVEHHKNDPAPVEEDEEERKRTDNISWWDMEFLKVDQKTLVDLMLAANYLNIGGLTTVACKTVANMLKGKTVEQIRSTFNIENDFPPGAEEKIRRENEFVEERK